MVTSPEALAEIAKPFFQSAPKCHPCPGELLPTLQHYADVAHITNVKLTEDLVGTVVRCLVRQAYEDRTRQLTKAIEPLVDPPVIVGLTGDALADEFEKIVNTNKIWQVFSNQDGIILAVREVTTPKEKQRSFRLVWFQVIAIQPLPVAIAPSIAPVVD